ncbi:hypothetical protein quinque_016403 [Culex quinquefasciatus]
MTARTQLKAWRVAGWIGITPKPESIGLRNDKSCSSGVYACARRRTRKAWSTGECCGTRTNWTPLIPATGWGDHVQDFGADTPLGRPGQPAELAGAYVYLASEDASYVSGAVLPVTGGKHL